MERIKQKRQVIGRLLSPARVVRVCLLLLVAQVALLAHVHEIDGHDEAESAEECELCLLLNALDDFIEPVSAGETIPAAPAERLDHPPAPPSFSLPAPQARGPPQA